jgi:hypothetical protein
MGASHRPHPHHTPHYHKYQCQCATQYLWVHRHSHHFNTRQSHASRSWPKSVHHSFVRLCNVMHTSIGHSTVCKWSKRPLSVMYGIACHSRTCADTEAGWRAATEAMLKLIMCSHQIRIGIDDTTCSKVVFSLFWVWAFLKLGLCVKAFPL